MFSRLVLALSALVASCLLVPPANAEPPASDVRLGYFANVTHAQAVLGVDSGDFAKALAPAKFSTKVFNAGPSLIEALFAGEIDIGYVGPSPAANAFVQSRGKGLRIIAGAAADGVVIVAGPDSGIQKLEDLKGKKIATPQLGNTQDISARHYLIKVLEQPDANNIVPVPNAEQAALLARGAAKGGIDAAWAVEPWGARLVAEAGGKIIAQEKDLWPDRTFTLTLIVVSPEFLAKHPDQVRAVLGVHRTWTARLRENAPSQAPALAAALDKLTGKKLSEEIIGTALSRVRFTDEPLAESIRTFAQWAYDLRLSKGVPDVAAMVDTSVLKSLQELDKDAAKPKRPTNPPTSTGTDPNQKPGQR